MHVRMYICWFNNYIRWLNNHYPRRLKKSRAADFGDTTDTYNIKNEHNTKINYYKQNKYDSNALTYNIS